LKNKNKGKMEKYIFILTYYAKTFSYFVFLEIIDIWLGNAWLSNNSDHPSNKPNNSLLTSFQTIKQECCNKEDNMNIPSYDPTTHYNNQESSSD